MCWWGLSVHLFTGLSLGVGSAALANLLASALSGTAHPAAGLDGVDVSDVHGVNLLEGAVLGLDDEEEDDGDEGGTASSEDQTVEVVDGLDDEGSEEGDQAGKC